MGNSEDAFRMRKIPVPRFFRSHPLAKTLVAAACLLAADGAIAQMLPLAHAVDGRTQYYIVQAGDTLTDISSRFGEDRNVLAVENGIDPDDRAKPLVVGRVLTIKNRHIVPAVSQKDDIYINLAQRRVFYFKDSRLIRTYLIGAGDPSWQTPIGPFHIINHIKNKTWMVPVSIQKEMRAKGQPVITSMPPGPNNPLGGYWIGTSLTNIGIHGTNDQDSVYRYASHGCMHMRSGDIEDFFSRVKVGDKGETVYLPVMMAALPDGRIYLEAHPDIYHKNPNAAAEVKKMTEDAHLANQIDWDKVGQVLAKREGYAIRVSLKGGHARPQDSLDGQGGAQGPGAAEQADPDHTTYPDMGGGSAMHAQPLPSEGDTSQPGPDDAIASSIQPPAIRAHSFPDGQ